MAHFAKINDDNEVLTVVVVNNSDIEDSNGNESESVGQTFCENVFNWPAAQWIQTSYNTAENKYYNDDGTEHSDQTKAFRGNYAGIGYTWDSANSIFWPVKKHASWVKDTTTASWASPLGDPPALTSEQESQNTAGTHQWEYVWNETAYQGDTADPKTLGWDLVDNLTA